MPLIFCAPRLNSTCFSVAGRTINLPSAFRSVNSFMSFAPRSILFSPFLFLSLSLSLFERWHYSRQHDRASPDSRIIAVPFLYLWYRTGNCYNNPSARQTSRPLLQTSVKLKAICVAQASLFVSKTREALECIQKNKKQETKKKEKKMSR
jgi:hypothetical protein